MVIQTYSLARSPQSSTLTRMQNAMSRPPMVGVPALRWWAATSSWMYWPYLSRVSQRMNRGPKTMERTRAVKNAAIDRNVM
ncbi:hypothetical protein DSECCO2_662700 [anaerobic digester metagenome]